MRKLFFYLAVLAILFSGNLYSQTGWFTQYSGTSNALRDVQFIDQNTGWMVGWYTILYTSNGGNNWIQQLSSTHGFTAVQFINSQTGWTSGGSVTNNVSYIAKTTNGGVVWNSVFNSSIGAVMKTYFINPDLGWGVTSKGYVLKSTDGGLSWSTIYINTARTYTYCIFVNQNTGWVTGDSGNLLKTTDGGSTWNTQTCNTSENLLGMYFLSPTTGFITAMGGYIFKTTNGGVNWISKPSGSTYRLNSVIFTNSSTGWVSGGDPIINSPLAVSQILRTNDGGESWSPQSTPTTNGVASIFMLNSSTGWAACMNGTILKTMTGGLPIPAAPVLVYPPNNSTDLPVNLTLQWNPSAGATSYKVQVSTVANFYVITDSASVTSGQYTVPAGKLQPGYTYFWRVKASNSVGASDWSTVWCFSTGLVPQAPILISPVNGFIGTSTTPVLDWDSLPGVSSYTIQISTVPNFTIFTDSATVLQSKYTVPSGKLSLNITYFWRVNARNNYGSGPWSSVWSFTPQPVSINPSGTGLPVKNELIGNYPNPFNPTTKIKFNVGSSNGTSLKNVTIAVFDASGRRVDVLVDGLLPAGTYEIFFNGEKLSGGIYFCRLMISDFTETKKMVLIK